MKWLVSDYDGTLKRFVYNPSILEKRDFHKDLKSISGFIHDGNKFIISTKRTTPSMQKELEKYDIDYSFLTTHEGLVTFDNNGELVYADYLNPEFVYLMKCIIDNRDIFGKIVAFDERKVEFSIDNRNLILLGIEVYNINVAMEYMKNCGVDLSSIYTSYKRNKIWIHNQTNKTKGIEQLVDLLSDNQKPTEIVAVSDSIEDLEMVRNYNGWCINGSELDRYGCEIKNISNIRRLIKTIK